MNILVVIPECGFSNTSSSIFSEMFLAKLSECACVDVVGFGLPDDYAFGVERPVFVRNYISIDSNLTKRMAPTHDHLMEKSKEPEKRWSSLFKRAFKTMVPDFFSVGLVDNNISHIAFDRYDYLISMSDPKSAHLLSLYLRSKLSGLRDSVYIQIWGDPWYHDITRETSWVTKTLERFVISKANFIFYRSQATLRLQKETYEANSKKMHMLHRGFSGKALENKIESMRKASFNFVYAGDYNPNVRNLITFSSLVGDYGHTLTLYGNTTPSCRSKLEGFKSVQQFSRLPRSVVELEIDKRDCLILVLNSKGTQVPGKIYDAIPIDKPVLLLLDGDIDIADIPASERFIIVRNDKLSIQAFFEALSSLKWEFNDSLNKYHIENVVYEFKRVIGWGAR